MIICATISADDASPSMSCTVQNRLGATCPAMDVSAACSGFVYALDTAAGYLRKRKKVKKLLIIGGEKPEPHARLDRPQYMRHFCRRRGRDGAWGKVITIWRQSFMPRAATRSSRFPNYKGLFAVQRD